MVDSAVVPQNELRVMRVLPQYELNRLEEWQYELSPTTVRSQSPGGYSATE